MTSMTGHNICYGCQHHLNNANLDSIILAPPQYTDAERHEGRRRIMHAGVDASLTESVDAECVKGVDAEHIHAGLRAGYRHRDRAVQKQSS